MKNNFNDSLYKFKKKKGISLIVLLITIIVSLILISAVVISTSDAIDNANINTFINDLTQIQDTAESYYISNNVLPVMSASSSAMTKDEILDIVDDSSALTEEITENNDLDAEFYNIDLTKLNITKIAYGTGENGENDKFVIAYPSMNVYFLYGLKVKNNIYFSITSRIYDIAKISVEEIDDSTVSIISSDGIKVTKSVELSNDMDVTIETDMAVGEQLYMSVSDDTNRLITTTVGSNVLTFDSLSGIVLGNEVIQIPSLTQTEADYIEQGTKPIDERYIDILKYKDGELIGKVRVDLSNYTSIVPIITSSNITSYSTMNILKLEFDNTNDTIKEVWYEYLTKFSENGTIESYYSTISDYDEVYMQTKAKKVKLTSDLTTSINAPKNIQSVKIAVVDKLGNVTLFNQRIAPNLYIGYTLDDSSQNSLQLTANMYSSNGIKSITFSKSINGTAYTDEQVYNLNTITNGVTSKQSTAYTGFLTTNAYIKMVAENFDSTITETRILKIDLTEVAGLGVNVIAIENSTVNGETAAYNNPIIPVGFKAVNTADASWDSVETDWDNGLVIEDMYGNQFVWVPVKDGIGTDGTNIEGEVQYEKWCTTEISYDNSSISEDSLPIGVTNEQTQIIKYGGFYIARYEAMFDYNGGNIRVASKKSINVTIDNWSNLRNETYDGYLWNWINSTDAKLYSQSMRASYNYDDTKVLTDLATGTQWDTLFAWVKNSGYSVIDSSAWDNYSNAIAPANVLGYGTLQVSGYSEYWKAKNIYNLAGNISEFTNELYNSSRIRRGGNSNVTGADYPAAHRLYYTTTFKHQFVGFRVALYIL